MSSISSRSNDSVVGIASSAAKIVVTSAILATDRHRRRRFRKLASPFDDDSSVKSLIAIDEGQEVTDFSFKSRRHPRVHVVRSRSPSPEPRGAPVKEIVLEFENRIEKQKRINDINDAIAEVRARNQRARRSFSIDSTSDDSSSSRTTTSSGSAGPEQVEFYLPQLGKDANGNLMVDQTLKDPTALVHILRPWQVDFLESLGIVTAKQFLHTKARGRNLSRDMKKWRKRQGMTRFRGSSCKVALHIWAATCKAVLRDVEQQRRAAKSNNKRKTFLRKPKFLQRSLSTDSLFSGTASTMSSDASVSSFDTNMSGQPVAAY